MGIGQPSQKQAALFLREYRCAHFLGIELQLSSLKVQTTQQGKRF